MKPTELTDTRHCLPGSLRVSNLRDSRGAALGKNTNHTWIHLTTLDAGADLDSFSAAEMKLRTRQILINRIWQIALLRSRVANQKVASSNLVARSVAFEG